MGDVITTGATILSLIIFRITGWNIDGVVGIGVALVVMWAGVGIAKDTLEPLIGEAIDPQVYDQIKAFVEKYDGIVGTHDLIVHNYGPGRSMASIHAEVPNDVDIEKSHEIIDRIERDAKQTLGLFLVIHMDPAVCMIFVSFTEQDRLILYSIWSFPSIMMRREETSFRC